MAVREFTAVGNTWNTNTGLRTEGAKISAAFAAVGLVKTADTGQIDFNTVTASTAAGGFHGYEMWRLGDGTGGLPSIFMRVEYRNGDNSSGQATMQFQTGTATDGAGNLTGTVSFSRRTMSSTNYAANTAQQGCQMSSDGSTYFWCHLLDNHLNQTQPMIAYVIERPRTDAGAANGLGWFISAQTQTQDQAVRRTDGQMINLQALMTSSPQSSPLQSCIFYGNYASLSHNNDLYFFPHYWANPGVASASPVILGHMASEITYGTKPVVNVYGTDRTFYSLGNRAGAWSATGNANHGVMLRWDV